MPILSRPSDAARTSVLYITAGTLIDVWSGIWFWYLSRNPPQNEIWNYICWGLLLTGAALLIIGLALGRIGRAARNAELPPKEVTDAQVLAETTAAARAPIVAPVNPAVGAFGNAALGAGVAVPGATTPAAAVPVAPLVGAPSLPQGSR